MKRLALLLIFFQAATASPAMRKVVNSGLSSQNESAINSNAEEVERRLKSVETLAKKHRHSGTDNSSTLFGSWTTGLSTGTVYQASTDGFVVLKVLQTSNTGGSRWEGLTDSATPPVTFRAFATPYDISGGATTQNQSFTMPVRKGDYWKVNCELGCANATGTLYWLPIGG